MFVIGKESLSAPARGVALVTRRAAVHIAIHVRVREVGGVVIAMAARALEYRVVSTIRVARGAYAVCVAMTGGKPRVVAVWERPAGPIGRAHAVAGPALRGREEGGVLRCGMRRTGGAVVIVLMAANAGVAVEAVVVVNVAVGAHPRRHRVLSYQCEARAVVIKRRVCPIKRVVARFARRGEASRCVSRVGCSSVIFLVARVAQSAIQRVVVVDVAVSTSPRRHRV